MNKNQLFGVAAAVACATTLAACGGAQESTEAATSEAASSEAVTAIPEGTYKDGSYHQDASYKSRDGEEQMSIDATLAGGAVSDLNVTYQESNQTSGSYLKKFSTKVKDKVVGVPLQEVRVDKLSGASATSEAFMEALNRIADDARQ